MKELVQENCEAVFDEMRKRREMLEDAIHAAPLCYSMDAERAQVEILDEFIGRLEAAHRREGNRNFHRFATVGDARKAHEAICEKYGKCHNGCPLNNEEHYSAFDCFEAWLFAPATEQEGVEK